MVRKAQPGGFVFEPRSVVTQPALFGKVSVLLEGKTDEPGRNIVAAQLQHLVANKVRERLAIGGSSLSAIPDSNYDRLARIARGETMMTITDLLMWCARFAEVRDLVAEFVIDVQELPKTVDD